MTPLFITPLSDAPAGSGAARGRFFDAAAGAWIVKVHPGDFCISTAADETIVTTLGSCVAACIHDPVAGIGGMNHFMLPEDQAGLWGDQNTSTRFGNFAMEKLINELLKRGCERARFEVKVFGGGNVIESGQAVGTKNAEFALRYLEEEGLKCVACDLGGDFPRRIQFFATTGRVVRRILGRGDAAFIIRDETTYADNLRFAPLQSGDVELFGGRR